jgi:8-oxo-dGTP pyrophosphatase MutT (NUDIX family)
MNKKVSDERPINKVSVKPTHAGGVVFRITKKGTIKYLLVHPKMDTSVRVLPKGHIESDESKKECAIREVEEEAGVEAKILSVRKEKNEDKKKIVIDTIDLGPKEKRKITKVYLMEYQGKVETDENRDPKWFTFDEVMNVATYDTVKELVAKADQIITKLILQKANSK